MANNKSKIVIIGHNYGNILTVIRGLGQAGYKADVLKVFKRKISFVKFLRRMKPESHSKYVGEYRKCVVENDKKIIVDELVKMADRDGKKMLIPTDDYTAYLVDRNYNKLKDYYILPNIDEKSHGIIKLMSKSMQKKLAREFDIPVTNGIVIKSKGGKLKKEDANKIKYPCFVKPDVNVEISKTALLKCDNQEELEKAVKRYSAMGGIDMLVEDYADIKHEYSIIGISAKDKVVVPGTFQTLQGGTRARKGVALTGKVLPLSTIGDLFSKMIDFVESLNYTGLFDIDLIETRDGKIYFTEINFRVGASVNAFTQSGANLLGVYADHFLKDEKLDPGIKVDNKGKKFVNEKVLIEEYARGDLKKSQVKKFMSESDILFIGDAYDAKPFSNFKKYYIIAALMRIPYKFK